MIARRFALCIVLAGIGMALAPAAAAQETVPVVRMATVPDRISKDDATFDVQVLVDNVTNLGAFRVELRFDDELMRATSIARTEFLGSSGREVVCSEPVVATDTVRLQCVTLRETPPGADGSAAIATVTFEPVKEGTASVELDARLSHPNGSNITVEVQNGDVKIRGDERSIWLWVAVVGIVVLLAVAAAAALAMRRRQRGRRAALPPGTF